MEYKNFYFISNSAGEITSYDVESIPQNSNNIYFNFCGNYTDTAIVKLTIVQANNVTLPTRLMPLTGETYTVDGVDYNIYRYRLVQDDTKICPAATGAFKISFSVEDEGDDIVTTEILTLTITKTATSSYSNTPADTIDAIAAQQNSLQAQINILDKLITTIAAGSDDETYNTFLTLINQLKAEIRGEDVLAALDTLKELGEALDNDPDFAATITTALGLKANTSDVNTALDLKADLDDMTAALALKADITYVDTLISSVGDGSPKGTYTTLSALQTAYPTGTTGIYIVVADGHWYYWNGTAWTDGGVYIANPLNNEVAELTMQNAMHESYFKGLLSEPVVYNDIVNSHTDTVKFKDGSGVSIKIKGNTVDGVSVVNPIIQSSGANVFDKSTAVVGQYIQSDGTIVTDGNPLNSRSGFIRVPELTAMARSFAPGARTVCFFADNNASSYISGVVATDGLFTTPAGTKYIMMTTTGVSSPAGFLDTFMLNFGNTLMGYVPYVDSTNLSVSATLRKATDTDKKDELEFINGKWQLTQCVDPATGLEQVPIIIHPNVSGNLKVYNYGTLQVLNNSIAPTLEVKYIPEIPTEKEINVKDYGAKGDGVTDDTSALRNALIIGAGKKIIFPKGVYIVTGTLIIKSDTVIEGYGEVLIKLGDGFNLTQYVYRVVTSTEYMYPIIITEDQSKDIVIKNISIEGNRNTYFTNRQIGLALTDTTNCYIEKVNVNYINWFPETLTSTGAPGSTRAYNIAILRAKNVIVKGGKFSYAGYECVCIAEDCEHIVLDGIYSGIGWRTSVQIHRNCRHVKIVNSMIEQNYENAHAAITTHGRSDEVNKLEDLTIENCIISAITNIVPEYDYNGTIQLMDTAFLTNIKIINNTIKGNRTGIYLLSPTVGYIVTGNNIKCDTGYGLYIPAGCEKGIVKNNIIDYGAGSNVISATAEVIISDNYGID